MTQTTTPTPDVRHVASYNSAVGHRADPYMNEGRVRLLVDVASHQQMIGEALLPKGKSTVDVPASTVADIKALVIDTQKRDQAQSHFAGAKRDWEEKNPGTKDLCPHSVSESYRLLFRSDMGCLNAVEVIEDELPPPMTPEERRIAAVAANVGAVNASKSAGKRR